nr:hypothetical protein [Tanacetum cinerariifolium]
MSTSSDNDKHVSYAQTVNKSLNDEGNKLFTIPTSVNSNGEEVVLFDEELVREGREKWKFTVVDILWGVKCILMSLSTILEECGLGKEYLEKVEINYVDGMQNVKMTKWVKVEYSWKPEKCSQCKVFGHTFNLCKDKPISEKSEANQEARVNGNKDSEGFVEIKNRKNKQGVKLGMSNGNQGNKQGYRGNVMNIQQRYVVKQKVPEPNNMK